MKTLPIIFCLALLSSANLAAQKKKTSKKIPKSDIELGVTAGATLSKISGSDVNYLYNYKIGYYGGFLVKYPLAQKFDLQAELLYKMIGSGMRTKNNDMLRNGNLNTSYITLPVIAQFKISPEIYFEAGPEFSYMIDSKVKEKDTGEIYEWKDRTKKFNIEIGLGAGYYFTNNIGVNIRANIGVGTPVAKTFDYEVSQFRMHNFQLGLIYLFK